MTISRIGSVTAAGASLTPTVGLAGDLMVAFAFRSTAATIPTVPAGWTTISSGSGNTCAGVLAYFWCTTTNDASGTWTGATQLIITKYRGVLGIGGAGTQSNATGTSISYPALTTVQTAGNSWFVGVAGHRTASNVSTAPTGMTNVSSVGTGPQAAFHDTNGGAASWSGQTVTVNASSGHESMTVELLADSATLNPLDKSASIALSGANLTATGSVGSHANARATVPKTSGQWFFEITVTNATTNPGIGLANSAFPLSNYLGQDANSVGYFNDGYVGYNDTAAGTSRFPGYSTFAAGDRVQCAFDATAQIVWFGVNDVYVGNPALATGGVAIPLFSTFFPSIQAETSDAVTVNFGASAWGGAGPPSGFLPFNGSSTATGSGAITLPITMAATGARGAAGSSAMTLALTMAAAGSTVYGQGAATLALTMAATGGRGAAGSGAITLASTMAATGGRGAAGSGAITLALAMTAGGSTASGAGAITLALGVAGSGTSGSITPTGSGAITLAATMAAIGGRGAAGSGAATLALTMSGAGGRGAAGAGAITLPLSVAGSGVLGPGGSGAITLALGVAGAGISTPPTVTGVGAITLALTMSGAGGRGAAGSGAAVLALGVSGVGFIAANPPTGQFLVRIPPRERRAYVPAIERRVRVVGG